MISSSSYLTENVDGYYAIELDPTSQNEVLKHGQHEVKASKHITIAYKPSESISGVLNSMLGRSFSISTSIILSLIITPAIADRSGGVFRNIFEPMLGRRSHQKLWRMRVGVERMNRR